MGLIPPWRNGNATAFEADVPSSSLGGGAKFRKEAN